MSSASGWVCISCQRQLRTRLIRQLDSQRRRFISLSDIADNQDTHELKLPSQPGQRHPNSKRRSTSAKGSRPQKSGSRNKDEGDELLWRMYKSAGRDLPQGPLTLRYSQRTLQGADTGQTSESWEGKAPIRRAAFERPEWRQYRKEQMIRSSFDSAPSRTPSLRQAKAAEAKLALAEQAEHSSRSDATLSSKPVLIASAPGSNGNSRPTEEQGPESYDETSDIPDEELVEDAQDETVKGADPRNTSDFATGFRWNDELDTSPFYDRDKVSRWPKIMAHHVKTKDLGRAATIWKNYAQALMDGKGPTDPSAIFTDLTMFLSYAVTGKLVQTALGIWSTMQEQNLRPNIRHWTMMLKLAGEERDLHSIKKIWASIKLLDEHPDNRTWAVLLWSLCSSPRVDGSALVAAIAEMEQHWQTQASKLGSAAQQETAKGDAALHSPSTVPYNSALARLVELGHNSKAKVVLQTMSNSKHQLKPTVNTFNILLGAAAKNDDVAETQRLLAEMKQHGLTPDKVTDTLLLDNMIRSIAFGSEVADQERQIKKLFQEMAASGYTASQHTYATALSSLLQRDEPNVAAARIVMQHMEQHGVEPSVYILTILVRHYTRKDSPQVSAADAIYQRVLERGSTVDHRFYDALIQGYAATGEADKMVKMLRFVPRTGHKLNWLSMIDALRLLVESGEHDIAAELVQDLHQGIGMGRLGCRNHKAKTSFWTLVEQYRQMGKLKPTGSAATVQ